MSNVKKSEHNNKISSSSLGLLENETELKPQLRRMILAKIGIEPPTQESFDIFIATLKTIQTLGRRNKDLRSLEGHRAPILPNLAKLGQIEIEFLESELGRASIPINECQVRVQKLIPQAVRKRFAAYYTVDEGSELMASITYEYMKGNRKHKVVLADPFLGSGRTLANAIKKFGVERLEKVWGIEPLPLPGLVAYASLLQAVGGREEIVTVLTGDAFEEIPKSISTFADTGLPRADIILTNPPFTRWKYLEKTYRKFLLSVVGGLDYKKYVTRQEPSLQTLSMFLSDYALSNEGLLVAVLPSSTFYTIYGKGYKSLLKSKYDVPALVQITDRVSFSEDSGFKEIILVAIKETRRRRPTAFVDLENNADELAKLIMGETEPRNISNLIDLHELPRFLDMNWLALFSQNGIRAIITEMFSHGLANQMLGYWNDVLGRKSLVRGIEMYGPEFFFVPNKYWRLIKEKRNGLEIENIDNGTRLVLNKEFLVRTLRKPSLYSRIIEANSDRYMLSVPPLDLQDLPEELRHYIRLGQEFHTAAPAINSYGKYWYSHIRKQIGTKKPVGHVFIPDKVDLQFKNRGVFANYARENTAASKNFYIVKDMDEITARLLIGWFNSTLFLSTLVEMGRKISDTWTRFLENDYLELPMINTVRIDREEALEVCRKVDTILCKTLPPLWEQLGKDYRYDLDLSLTRALRLPNPEKVVGEFHKVLHNKFNRRSHKT